MTTSTQDYIDVVNVVHQDFQRCDAKDFSGARSLWADELTLDLGGVNPDAEGVVTADALKDAWERLLGPMELTQHMLTSHVVSVDGDEAAVTYHLQALHYHSALGKSEDVNTWTLYGRGTHQLRRTSGSWKVAAVRLAVVHSTGNKNMPADIMAVRTPSRN